MVSKDFKGATLEIGGILGLRNKNVSKKLNFDTFCSKLGIYLPKELKNGEHVFTVTKVIYDDPVTDYEAENKLIKLTDEENKIDMEVDIKREEVKSYVYSLNFVKSNLKKFYSLVVGNCIDGV